MKTIKSQPKLKFINNKHQNYITQKNSNVPVYMDDRAAQRPQLVTQTLQSYSSLTIQPRAKLSYSLNDKIGSVLSDSRKMGMIQKIENPNIRKSLAKISHTSALPPIKTQVQQTFEYLNKLKYQLNDVALKSIKISNEVSNLQGQINITREKSKALKQILSRTGQKQLKHIQNRNYMIQQVSYHQQVRGHMYESLKTNNRTLAKRKHVLSQRLKTLKIELHSVSVQLDNQMASNNNNIYTTKVYKNKQQLTSEQIYMKSTIAQAKLTHERNADKVHKKLQQIQTYDKDQYRYQTNLKAHYDILKQIRVQQVLNKFMASHYQKYQTIHQQSQKCYCLIKMYANLSKQIRNQSQKVNNVKAKTKTKNSQTVSDNKSFSRNNSTQKIVIQKQQQLDKEIDIVLTYQNSFKTRQQLQKKIKQKQELLAQLQRENQSISQKWIQRFFNDNVTNGSKPGNQDINYSKQIKKLVQKQRDLDKKKITQIQVQAWIKKQEIKLNFSFSKKISGGQRILKMLEYISNEAKNIKQMPKYEVLSAKDNNNNSKKKAINKSKPK